MAGDGLTWILGNLGWVFVLSTTCILALLLFLAVTPYGRLRLGADDDVPEFRTASWVAMMFSAGMGIGLMFFGVSEPITHLAAPPLGQTRPGTPRPPPQPWNGRTCTGRCTPGRSMRSWGSRSASSASARACRTSSARRSTRCSATACTGRADRQGHRHPRGLRDRVRQRDLARTGCPADQQRQGASGVGRAASGRQTGRRRQPWAHLSDAVTFTNGCRDLSFVLEQPCNTFEELVALRARAHHPIFVDELAEDLDDVLRAISMGAPTASASRSPGSEA